MFPAFAIVFSATFGPFFLLWAYGNSTKITKRSWMLVGFTGVALTIVWAGGIGLGAVPLEGKSITLFRAGAGILAVATTTAAIRRSAYSVDNNESSLRMAQTSKLTWISIPAATVQAGTAPALVTAIFSSPNQASAVQGPLAGLVAAAVTAALLAKIPVRRMVTTITLSGIGAWSVAAVASLLGVTLPSYGMVPITRFSLGDAGSASLSSIPAGIVISYLGLEPRWGSIATLSFLATLVFVWYFGGMSRTRTRTPARIIQC